MAATLVYPDHRAIMSEPHRPRIPPDEQAWARRVRASEVEALEEAFRTCYAAMCTFVCVQVGSAETAEDLVQDVFMRVWQTRDRLDVNGSLRNLLYRSAHNAALNFLKHRTIESRWLRTTPMTAASIPAEDSASLGELSTAVETTLAALPERCRQIFLMSRYQGLSYSEIAQNLNLSVKTVETQMGRALKALRTGLTAYMT